MTDPAFVSRPLAIEPSFLDHNGHVNMAYHLVMADRALDEAFAAFGVDGSYVATRGMTTFAGELHVRYLREIHAADRIVGRVLLTGGDEKRIVWAVELIREPGGETVTTVEGVSLSVDATSRRVAPFPPDILENARRVMAGHEQATRPDWLGRHVGMPHARAKA
jgi:acyl-CoA thioester hydrolase